MALFKMVDLTVYLDTSSVNEVTQNILFLAEGGFLLFSFYITYGFSITMTDDGIKLASEWSY